MFVFNPPVRVPTSLHFRLPDTFRQKQRNAWSDPNRMGQAVDCFLEGPSFDRAGNLFFVDIPFGRIFVADYKNGLMLIDAKSGRAETLLGSRNSEGFKGLNDLVFAGNGDCYFTDQGQTGMHDPTGRVYRLAANGRLDCLLTTVPSPNGIVLNIAENRAFVAVTRQNAVWRVPLMPDGSVTKVGTYLQLSGGHAGPDGMAVDQEDGLYVCHLGLGIWRFDSHGMPTHLIESCTGQHMTNLAFGGPDNKSLFITESDTGTILRAEMPFAGKPLYSHQG